MKKQKIIVILGTTATGKSNLAVQVAKKINGEVVSADSRQVYKTLDIGTGKITKNEMHGIPHHLLDVANPKHKFTVVKYKELAEKSIEEIIKHNNVPIVCGGTGFYINSITEGTIFPEVPPDFKLRKLLNKKTAEELFIILKKLDKTRAKNIYDKNEQNNKIRLIRAIEIAKILGSVPRIRKIKSKYNFIKIGLYLPDNILKEKIEKRVKKMFKDGLLEEIKKLKQSRISQKRLQEFGFEYNNPTIDTVISETIKYAKRQTTWFKRDKNIIWFDASKKNTEKNILSLIMKTY